MRYNFSATLVFFLAFQTSYSQKTISVADALRPSDKAEMSGYIGNRLHQSFENRILAQDVDHLIEPFLHRNETRLWQSEFWGKWFTSAVLAYRYNPDPRLKTVLASAVKKLIDTQSADGYIGNYSEEARLQQWDIWGRKYVMLGLLDYYEISKDKASLKAATKVADHLIKEINERDGKIVNKGNYRGMAASSVLEPMVKLYNVTKNAKYLNFAKEIVTQWETPEGPNLISKAVVNVSERFPKPASWYSPEQGQKAYEMMSCYEGLLELYRVTGEKQYLDAVEKTWRNIRDTEINICGSGASEEMWFGGRQKQTMPVRHYQEVCVTVTWIKLNQQLLRLTGEAQYADEIERAYYNALLGSLNGDASDWAKYTPLNGERLPGSGQCGMNINCCNASGARGLFTLPLTSAMATRDGISVNFYNEGRYELKTTSGKKVVVKQTTTYPVTGPVNVSLELAGNEEMVLKVRIPAWSNETKVNVNGESIAHAQPGAFLEIRRTWSNGDNVEIEFDMSGKVIVQGEGRTFAAITRGPIVMARDSRFGGPHLSTIQQPVADANGTITLNVESGEDNGEYWIRCTAPFIPESFAEYDAKPQLLSLCDYASAGNGKTSSVFKVWLPLLYSGRSK